jgi:hypothetical protein
MYSTRSHRPAISVSPLVAIAMTCPLRAFTSARFDSTFS